MIPKHDNPTKMRRDRRGNEFWARAPYNFVPLPEKVVYVDGIPDLSVYSGLNGYIQCSMTTESPLYTRCGMSPDFFSEFSDKKFYELPPEKQKERAQFFHLNDANCPIIPGSSLRGMVRSLVEIAGYAKVQYVTDEKLVFRAVGEGGSLGGYYLSKMLGPNQGENGKIWLQYPLSEVRGGYLKKNGSQWSIKPAKKHNGETFVHVEYNAANCGKHNPKDEYNNTDDCIDVFIHPPANRTERTNRGLTLHLAVVEDPSHVSQHSKPEFEKAVLVRSGHMGGGRNKKHMHCAIYEPDDNVDPIDIPDEMRSLYEKDRDKTRGYKTRYIKNDGDPLFYLVDDQDKLVFFGPTMMFRLPYNTPVNHFIPEELRSSEGIDLAEAIFGYVNEKKNTATAGRVFFTDATLECANDGIWSTKEPITPKILASPKPTSFPHYLVQDKDKGHDPDNKNSLAHYAESTPEKTLIRGSKMYWHKGEITLEDIKADPEEIHKSPKPHKQYTSIRPINNNVTFSFNIYFENLCDFELGAMLWVLNLPGETGKVYRHKLGMGKPLGMGAIKIEPELHLQNRDKRYNRLFDDNSNWAEPLDDADPEFFMEEFEQYVMNALGCGDNKFNEIERIIMLLKMLEWPGEDPGLTRYLQSLGNNEYKERAVLPDPLNISLP